MKTNKEVFRCDYFTVEELTEGVYAAYAAEEGGALSNSGVIDLGDKSLVFDTFLSCEAAQELRKFTEKATGKKAAYVINSHSHFDHIMGNCSFDRDTKIIATKSIHNELKSHENEIYEMKKDAPEIVRSLIEKMRVESDETSRKAIERDIRYFEMVGRDSFAIKLPDITFEGSLELSGNSGRTIHLLEMKGHTGSDIVLYLPDERIAFMGDLLFTGTHPWLGAGDPIAWINAIKELNNYDVDMLVPGHGQIGNMYELSLVEGYIKEIASAAMDINEGRLKLEETSESMLPEPYCRWRGNKFIPNLRFYCNYLKKV